VQGNGGEEGQGASENESAHGCLLRGRAAQMDTAWSGDLFPGMLREAGGGIWGGFEVDCAHISEARCGALGEHSLTVTDILLAD
jgi:hypothetical protein